MKAPNTNFTKFGKNDLYKSNFSKFYLNAIITNPNITKYTLEPPNTGILEVFSVFANTKCHSLTITQETVEEEMLLRQQLW